jgi:SAM-dependent methyltransferase
VDDFVYDELAAVEGTHWWFQGRRRILVDVLRHRLPAGDSDRRIVDVGCGTGEMLDMVREFGAVTGLDASPIAVRYCKLRFGDDVDVRLGRIPDDIPEDVSLITAFDVIEHLEDDEKALRGISERLAPGGIFVCTVPAYPFLWSPHDEVHHHYRRYTRRQLRSRLREAGFTVERLSYFNTVLFPLAAVVRLLHRLVPGAPAGSDVSVPAGPANRLLLAVFAAERAALRRMNLPFGISLLAVCHRPASAAGSDR